MKSFLLLISNLISTKGVWQNGFKYSRDLGRDPKLTTKTTLKPWIKVGLSPSKKTFFVWFDQIPLKIMKNAFYFTVNAFFVLEIFKLDFSRKKASQLLMLYSINWSNFIALIALTSWDIGQYVYCNCLLTRLQCHKFWN